MNMKFTEIAQDLAPNQVRKFAHDEFPDADLADYKSLGVTIAEDADVDGALEQAGFTPLQYLQYPLGKPIEMLTTPVVIDKICGRSIVADWETAQVIQPAIEQVGVARLYGDDSDTPFASVNYGYELRDVQRFELGCRLGKLEDARLAKMGVLGFKSPWDVRRGSVAKTFQLLQDEIGHRGFINGSNVTSGLLTDNNLLEFVEATTPTGAASSKWSDKSYDQICADIRAMFATLCTQTDTHFDGMAGDKCKLVLSPAAKNALTKPNTYGKSVLEWVKENYEGCEIIADPRFTNAFSGGVDGAMLIADELNGNEVVKQYVPTLMRLLGVEKRMKHVAEDYTFATAGVMVKQPLGITTLYGV